METYIIKITTEAYVEVDSNNPAEAKERALDLFANRFADIGYHGNLEAKIVEDLPWDARPLLTEENVAKALRGA